MKILFSSHDPGGCNMLIPIIESLQERKGISLFLAFAGPATSRITQINTSGIDIIKVPTIPFEDFPNECDVNQREVRSILQQIQPDIVVTSTSINSNIERFFILFAQELLLKDYAFIDSWAGEDVRFNSTKVKVVPSNIFVCDSQMGKSYKKYQTQGSKIITVGNPHLEVLSNKKLLQSKHKSDCSTILFCSENIKHYFPNKLINEFTIIEEIIKSGFFNVKTKLLIRPHPMESKLPWQQFIERNESSTGPFSLHLDLNPSVYDSILNSDVVFGISSMALIESAILGVPTFSYQLGIEKNSDMLYIPFKDYGINILKTASDLKKIITNLTDLPFDKTKHNNIHINAVANTLSELVKQSG